MALDKKSAQLLEDVRRQLVDLTPEKVLAASPETIAAALAQLRAAVDTAQTITAPQLPLTASEAVAGFAAWIMSAVPALDSKVVEPLVQSFVEVQHLGTVRPGYQILIASVQTPSPVVDDPPIQIDPLVTDETIHP